MFRCIGKQSAESVLKKKRKAAAGRICRKGMFCFKTGKERAGADGILILIRTNVGSITTAASASPCSWAARRAGWAGTAWTASSSWSCPVSARCPRRSSWSGLPSTQTCWSPEKKCATNASCGNASKTRNRKEWELSACEWEGTELQKSIPSHEYLHRW